MREYSGVYLIKGKLFRLQVGYRISQIDYVSKFAVLSITVVRFVMPPDRFDELFGKIPFLGDHAAHLGMVQSNGKILEEFRRDSLLDTKFLDLIEKIRMQRIDYDFTQIMKDSTNENIIQDLIFLSECSC